jgi:hypothetical protein
MAHRWWRFHLPESLVGRLAIVRMYAATRAIHDVGLQPVLVVSDPVWCQLTRADKHFSTHLSKQSGNLVGIC